MSDERRTRIKELLAEAAELPTADRSAFLDRECVDDPSLRAELDSLLAHLDATVASGGRSSADQEFFPPAPRDPKRIAGYTVIDRLGEGGMGVVYKATQDYPRRTVALKVIKPHMTSPASLERFRFETQVLAKLTHPGIAQIYEAGTTTTAFGEQPYFAMELVRGKPLLEHATLRKLTVKERLALICKIAEAVHHAHTRGVVHRDLKPGNILVTESGEPKILDFGVARSIGGDPESTSARTEIGQLVGTLPYMSPEQIDGDHDQLDARSDVYSLGVVMYELLAGHLPYNLDRKLIAEAIRVIREVEPGRLSSVSRVFRGDVETIVGKALAKDRTRRYQSASELAADIYRFMHDEPITARPASAAYQVRKFAKRHRVIAGGVAVGAVGIVAGLAVTTVMLQRAVEAERQASASRDELDRAVKEVTAQRDRAELALRQLTAIADISLDFERSIHRLVGATAARRILAESAARAIEPLAEAAESIPSLRMQLARSQRQVGAIALIDDLDPGLAQRSFGEALRIYDSLLESTPGDPDLISAAIDSSLGFAVASLRRGGTQPAMTMVLRAEALAASLPVDEAFSRARVLRVKGQVLRQQGRSDEAQAAFVKCIKLLTRLSTERDLEVGDLLVAVRTDLAMLLDASGQNDAASDLLEQAVKDRRLLIAEHPSDAVLLRRYLALLYFSAERLEEDGRDREALELHLERLRTAESLRRSDPDDARAAEAVVTSHDAIGHAFAELGEHENAARYGDVFLGESRRQAEQDPTDLVKQRRVALAYEFRADLALERASRSAADGLLDDAIKGFEAALGDTTEALATIEWLMRQDPARVDLKQDRARLLLSLARVQELLYGVNPEHPAAQSWVETYQAADACYAALDAASELDDASRSRWARAVRNLGTWYLNSGDGANAVECLERADAIEPRPIASVAARKAAAYALIGDAEAMERYKAEAYLLLDSETASSPDEPAASALRARIEAITIQPKP